MESFSGISFGSDSGREPDLSVVLGDNVKRLRVEQGLNKKTFSLMVGVGRPLLNKVESGKADLRLSYIIRIADGLSVSPLELLIPPDM